MLFFLMPTLVEFPLSVVQRTHLLCFEAAGDAGEVLKLPRATAHLQK